MEQITCSECHFWKKWGGKNMSNRGDCQKNPPVVVVGSTVGTYSSVFPDTQAGDFCGEVTPKL